MEVSLSTSSPFTTLLNDVNVSDGNDSRQSEDNYDREVEIGRTIIIISYPIIILIGTIGNVLTFIVMRRGLLKDSSTCFYMAVLALSEIPLLVSTLQYLPSVTQVSFLYLFLHCCIYPQ